ncbi:MAG: glycosyltransferase family 39 protein [Patescibacteria group bacterium]
MNYIKGTKTQTFFLTIIILCALFFSTYKLSESPSVWYDEGGYFQISRNISEGYGNGLRTSPENVEQVSKVITVGYPMLYPLAFFLDVFGPTILAARIFMVIFLLILLLLSFVIIRRVFSYNQALMALALIATFPPLYGNGKTVIGEVPGIVFLMASLCFLTYFITSSKYRGLLIFLSGITAGLCISTKPTFLVLIPALVCAAGYLYFKKQISKKYTSVFFLSTVIPIGLWLLMQFRGDSFSDILNFYLNPQHVASLSTTVINNLKTMFLDSGLLYFSGSFILWCFAIFYRVYKKKDIHVVEIMSFIFSALIIMAFLRTAGYYRYLFQAQIVSLMFLPNSLMIFLRLFFDKIKLLNPKKEFVVPGMIIALSLVGIFQLSFHSWVAIFYTSHKTEFWINYFNDHDIRNTLFYDVPEVALFAHGTDYYQYLNLSPGAGITVGKENLALLQNGVFDQVFMKSSILDSAEGFPAQKYHVVATHYKYSILEKNKK